MKVFREAINREKDSIAFSLGMKELVPENRGKEKIVLKTNEPGWDFMLDLNDRCPRKYT